MSRLLKVNGKALTPYLQVEHEAGMDPANPEFAEPQFSGSPAFSEGKAFVGDAVDNRLMSFPMILSAEPNARTNLATNPSGEITSVMSGTGDFAPTRQQSGVDEVPSVAGEWVSKFVFDGVNSSTFLATINITLPAAGTYTASIYVWIPSAWDGTALRLTQGNYTGVSGVTATTADLTKRDQWQRISITLTVKAEDLAGAITLERIGEGPKSVGAGSFYLDALQVETGKVPTSYCDGDMFGFEWTGAPHESSTKALVDTDGLYELVRQVNRALVQGAQVEFRSETASSSSFLDLEAGRLEPKFEWWIDGAARVRAMLHLWTRPYAHTGTTRLIASLAGSGVMETPATGIIGDVDALGNIRVGVGSQAASGRPRVVAYAVARSASYKSLFAGLGFPSVGASGMEGASGALASTFQSFNPVYTASQAPLFELPPSNNAAAVPYEAYIGRHRLFVVARHNIVSPSPVGLTLFNARSQKRIGDVSYVDRNASQWQLVDMGEVSYRGAPPGATGILDEPYLYYVGAPGASSALNSLKVSGMIFMPLDVNAGIVMAGTYSSEDVGGEFITFRSHPKTAAWHGELAASALLYRGEMTDRMRGGRPTLPPVSSPAASGPLRVVAFSGRPDNFLGNDRTSVEISVRERFTYLR